MPCNGTCFVRGRWLRETALLAMALMVLLSMHAQAQTYPDRPLKLVVPFAPGGGSDLMARIVAEPLSQRLGQPVVVDNRPGANAMIGADYVAKAPADGYTLLYTPPGPQITNPSLMAKLPYDPLKDLLPIARLGVFVAVLVVHPGVPARNLSELLAYAKTRPGALSFSSPGVASANHLGGEYLKSLTGIDIVHVPYKGSSPALQDLLAGRVQMTIDTLAVLLPHIRSGALRPIAVAALERTPSLPDLPTLAETLEGFDASSLAYISVRASTPSAITERLNREINLVLEQPGVRARLQEIGVMPQPGTPEEVRRQVERERVKWKKVIDAAGLKPE